MAKNYNLVFYFFNDLVQKAKMPVIQVGLWSFIKRSLHGILKHKDKFDSYFAEIMW